MSKVGIIGAGAWGTALGNALSRGGHDVEMWALEEDVIQSINNDHENKRFLPGFDLDEKLTANSDIIKVSDHKDFIIIGSPSMFLVPTVKKIVNVENIQNGRTIIATLTKGFVETQDSKLPKLILETIESVLPKSYQNSTVYIAGPSHAEEVASGVITGLIAASNHHRNAVNVRNLLRVPGILAYASFDPIGVQICAAVKNVIAVAYGAMDALSETSSVFGDNTGSLLLAAGLTEITKIGFAMGAKYYQTFTSLSGVGDLDVTCKSKYGRNRRFGQDIVKKGIISKYKNIDDLILNIKEIGYLSEGAVACKYVYKIAQDKNLNLPVCKALYRILDRQMSPEESFKMMIMNEKLR